MYANFQTNQILTIEAIRYLWLKGIEVDDKNNPNYENIQIQSDKIKNMINYFGRQRYHLSNNVKKSSKYFWFLK